VSRELVTFAEGQKQALVAAMLAFLDRPDAAGRLMTAMGGFLFEDWLAEQAQKAGFDFENVSEKRLPYDLVINGYRVQAKSSGSIKGTVDVRPVRPVVGSTCRRYSLEDFDVLAIHLASFDERYFIPVNEFRCPQFQEMVCGCFVRERHAKWRDAWSVIEGKPGVFANEQMLLF
jgi:hypothetical protein